MLAVLLLTVILALFSLITGVLVWIRNNRDPANARFFIICILAAGWSIAFEITYVIFASPPSQHTIGALRFVNRLSFALGLLLMYSVAVFSYYFPLRRQKKTALVLMTPVVILTAIFSFTRAIAGKTTIENGGFVITNGQYSWVYSAVMLSGTAIIILNLVTRRRELDAIARKQLKLLAYGFGFSLTIGLLLSVIAPLLFTNLQSSIGIDAFSPVALIFFLVPVGAAVARYKLFEFRAVLARALAYIASIGTLILMYVVVGFAVSYFFISPADRVSLPVAIAYLSIGLILALAYGSLKKLFNNFTKHLFFRDAYEPQVFLDQLNRVLVSNIEIEKLLRDAARVIEDHIKPDFCLFAIEKTTYSEERLVGIKHGLSGEAVNALKHNLPDFHHGVIVADFLEESYRELRKNMTELDIAIAIRLSTSLSKNSAPLGYIFLGPKKSGDLYVEQDVRILSIIAKELVIAIQNALRFEEIEQFNITLQDKVDDATKRLRLINDKLRQMDETKDEFISMASHQLRTPLTSVKGYLSMVLEGDAGKLKGDQAKLLNQAFVSSQRMVYLIADLLNVSRLKTGKFIIESVPTNLADVVEGEISQLTETAKGRNLDLVYNRPKDFPVLMLDETKIRQVIMNFVDNAIYYTPAGGHIAVNLAETPETVEFTVVDDGLGVPRAEQHHLFSKFYRAGNAKKARPDGTGLGLFMAKKVIIAQGGAIIFKSQEGKGSTFGFSFSKKQLPKVTKPQPAGQTGKTLL